MVFLLKPEGEHPPLFRYQEFEKGKIMRLGKTAIIAPPGSGKTRPIIEAFEELGLLYGPVLIMCTSAAYPTWRRQIPLWSRRPELRDQIHTVAGGKLGADGRRALWRQAHEGGIYITNHQIFQRDYEWIRTVAWRGVIVDEYHKFMRRRTSTTFKLFKSFTRHIEHVVYATGSLMRRDATSMFTLFQLVDPHLPLFRSYWRFVGTFCHVDNTSFGKQIYGVKNPKALRDMMDRYLAYVPDEVVADSLPSGLRSRQEVVMTDEQAKVYSAVENELMALVGDDIIIAPTVLSKLTKLRQLLCCPRMLSSELGLGGGYEAIVDTLDTQSHVVIFVPFRLACDYIAADLREKGYTVGILRGGLENEEQAEIIREFREKQGIIVGTIDYAESYDLETCDTSWFLGYHMTTDQNEQAEGRTRRASSEHKFITWRYIVYEDSIDQYFLDKLGQDSANVRMVMKRSDKFIAMLRGEVGD